MDKPESRTIMVQVKDLIPYANNPRKNDQAVEGLKKSLDKFGYVSRIVVADDMTVVAGHTRLKAMLELGWQEKEIEVVQYLASPQDVRAFRLVDNKSGEKAEWDEDLLEEELNYLDDYFDVDDLGFDVGFGDECVDLDDAMGEDFELPDGEKGETERIAFILTTQQAAVVREALDRIPEEDSGEIGTLSGFKISEVCRQWLAQRT